MTDIAHFPRPGQNYPSGVKMVCDLKIEFELGWWENSTLQGLFSNAEFTVVMQMSAVGGVVMVMVVVVVILSDMSLFALDTATGVARGAIVDFLL